jgi:hypothetical protein
MRATAFSIGLLASTAVGAAIRTDPVPEATVAISGGSRRLNKYTNPYPGGSRYRRGREAPVIVKAARQDPSTTSVGTPNQQAAPAQQASSDASSAADQQATDESTVDELAAEDSATGNDAADEEPTDVSNDVATEQADSNDTTNVDDTPTNTDAVAPSSSGTREQQHKPKAILFYATIDDEYKIQKSEDGTFQILVPNPDYNTTHTHHSHPPTMTVFDSGKVVGKVELIINPGTSVTVYGDQVIDDMDAPATPMSDAPDVASASPAAIDTPAQSSPVRSIKKSKDGSCGPGNGDTSCLGSVWGNCCSVAGYCGKTAPYCGGGCKVGYGSCGSNDGDAEPIPSETPVQVSSTTTKDATCGAKNGGQTCAGSEWGDCCSMAGYCGMTDNYCGIGCQEAFGKCDSTADKKSSVAVAAPSQDAAAPVSSGKRKQHHKPTSEAGDTPISTDAATPTSSRQHKEHHKPASNFDNAPISTDAVTPSSSRRHKEHHKPTSSTDNTPTTVVIVPSSSGKHKGHHKPTTTAVVVPSPSPDAPSPSPNVSSDAGQPSAVPSSVTPPGASPSSVAESSVVPLNVVSSDAVSPSPAQSSLPAPADVSPSAVAQSDSSLPAPQSPTASSSSAANQDQASQVPLEKRGESGENAGLVHKDPTPTPPLPELAVPENPLKTPHLSLECSGDCQKQRDQDSLKLNEFMKSDKHKAILKYHHAIDDLKEQVAEHNKQYRNGKPVESMTKSELIEHCKKYHIQAYTTLIEVEQMHKEPSEWRAQGGDKEFNFLKDLRDVCNRRPWDWSPEKWQAEHWTDGDLQT